MADTATASRVAELQEALRNGGRLGARIRNGLSRRGDADAREAAGRLLGVKPVEIAAVADTPAGPVITTSDGQRYIAIPDDRPDAEGKVGLAFLHPTASPGTNSGFPVYAPHPDEPALIVPDTSPEIPAEPPAPEEITTRAELDRRLAGIDQDRDALVEARVKATTVEHLDSIDARLRRLDHEALALRNRRPGVAHAEAAAGEQRGRDRRAELERREAEAMAAAAPICERILVAHAELDVVRERAVAAGLGEHWRDRAKRPRGAFGEFTGPAHPGFDLLDAFAEWRRNGEVPLKRIVPGGLDAAKAALGLNRGGAASGGPAQ